jgi:hypothetical protein
LAGLAASGGGATASRAIGDGRARINWATILEQLPKQFRANDVREEGGLTVKRDSEIYAGINRWIEAGTVKRKERGLYERTKESKPGKTKKST